MQQLKNSDDGTCVASADQAILALLRSRDRIQFLLDRAAQQPETAPLSPALPSSLLIQLSNDDACLGRWSPQFTAIAPYPNWRKSLNPPDHHWWWPPAPAPITNADQPWIDWVLGGLTIALLTVCLALARDISTRFLTGAPGIWSSIGAIAPAALALFATGGALTKVGKQLIDTVLVSTWKVAHYSPWIKFGLAAVLTAVFFIGHFQGLPWAANRYHATGEQQYYNQGKLASAQGSFQRALQLNPNFPEANHSLALTYEDLRDFDSAKAEYVKAVNAGLLKSVNNLARLQIKEEQDYESAAVLLLTALQDKGRDRKDATLEYGLRKNLGWAWLEQNRLLQAQGELIKANRLEASLPEPRPD
ncbi:MAG: tetratricopeptide repeat protein, partial [Pseudomonadota bacterium]